MLSQAMHHTQVGELHYFLKLASSEIGRWQQNDYGTKLTNIKEIMQPSLIASLPCALSSFTGY